MRSCISASSRSASASNGAPTFRRRSTRASCRVMRISCSGTCRTHIWLIPIVAESARYRRTAAFRPAAQSRCNVFETEFQKLAILPGCILIFKMMVDRNVTPVPRLFRTNGSTNLWRKHKSDSRVCPDARAYFNPASGLRPKPHRNHRTHHRWQENTQLLR
jgi:hypothetical protein